MIKTAYCFQSSNQHIIAAAFRVITGCGDQSPIPIEWQPSTAAWQTQAMPERLKMATAYHIAPAHAGWIVVYPDVAGFVPFASALSRQSHKLTVSIIGERIEAWQGGHPVALPNELPDILDVRYFCDRILPPVPNWGQWMHLWSKRLSLSGAERV